MWKKNTEQRQKTRLEKRVASIPTADLVSWADQALSGIGRNLTAWQRSQEITYVLEAEEAAEALHAVVKELRTRIS